MRLGILIFDNEAGGTGEQTADALALALRARDIDVVVNAPEPDALTTPERPAVSHAPEETPAVVLTTFEAAQEAGARLGRADCDGVLFWLGAGANPTFAAPAALTLACPILLCGSSDNPALYNTAGVLADRGISFDRLFLPEGNGTDAASRVDTWLKQNSKKERQKGAEAAQKLFGKRLSLADATQTAVDAAQWFHQFGVLVVGAETGVEAEENDLVVQNGDGYAELTFFLLRGVCDEDEKSQVRALRAGETPSEPEGEPATLVQITRRKGRFTCLLALSPPAVIQSENFARVLFGSTVHSAPGDVRVRMRAACSVLDIDVVEWAG